MQNKQQEYLKQRERLRYVTQSHVSQRALDPDIMIEQLISDEKTFRFNAEPQLPYVLPKWLKKQNNLVPALYEQVWQAVKLAPANQFCDTGIITQFFTTSGLTLEKLGHLWSLTNVCSPGALTQQELYVMLTLIALVQAGYNVKDISILNGINHPILPQLDYNFLNIAVTNPAINRNSTKSSIEPKSVKTSSFSNGYKSSSNSFAVPPPPLPIKSSSFSSSSSSSTRTDPTFDNFFDRLPEPTFAMPEVKVTLNHNVDLLNIDRRTELNVDSPEVRFASQKNSCKSSGDNVVVDFLSAHDFSSEPKSLDLPAFSVDATVNVNDAGNDDDDEFTEFQSAVIAVPSTEEYTDFQSASPIIKYELEKLAINDSLDLTTKPQLEPEPVDVQSTNDADTRMYKTTHEADKYDVFRSLIEQDDEKPDAEEVVEDEDEEEEGEDDADDEFNDFCAVTSTTSTSTSTEKPKISIKEKCLEACLQLLQEGSAVFSSMSSEQVIREVLSDKRGYRYLNQLKIVYETSQRFQRQFEHAHLNTALQLTWEKLSSYTKFLPSEDLLDDDIYAEDTNASLCKLCETKCDMNYVRYAGNHYHVTCINLFLHFVEDSEISAMLNL